MTWHDLIREAREAQGLSQAQLAKAVGVSQATINKIENESPQSTRALHALIAELKLDPTSFPPEAFGPGVGNAPAITRPIKFAGGSGPLPEFARDPAYWAAAAGLVGDVPLYAAAEGGEGALLIERDSIGTVKRPPLLQGVKDGYAIYLVGESMAPEFEPGDILMINPRLPVLANTSCVFYSTKAEEPSALVKRFLSATDEKWRVKQFRPEREFELDRAEWGTRHRIVTKDFRR
ncbi:helix-turn-helix domain-containing protein [Methylobacterium durans]|nr:helix-turn-helix domain-containing protein [Methylobacterium durans]